MFNIKKQLRGTLISLGYPEDKVLIDYPTDAQFGDYSTNLAMAIAKEQGKPPMEVAKEVISKMSEDDYINDTFEKVKAVKPGFVNLYIKDKKLVESLDNIINSGADYGKSDSGRGKKVQVEFISANPTGPLTLANGRGGFTGDVLANVLSLTGYEVQREYYVNDIGKQIDILGHSILKDEQAEYKGKYIDQLGKEIKETDPYTVGKNAAPLILEKYIKPAVKKAGIRFDNYFSERKMLEAKTGNADEMFLELKKKKLVYDRDGAMWLKTAEKEDSDDKDRVLIKSDGRTTYFLSDIAYHWDKFHKRKFDKVINIWGADHHGYVARMKTAVDLIGYPGQLEVLLMQLVRLIKDGKEVRMSKRKGVFILLEDLIDEVGLDATRWFFLMRAPNTHMDFDLDLAKERSKKNPVYYVQYAHTRLYSIIEKAKTYEIKFNESRKEQTGLADKERRLAVLLLRWPELVKEVASSYHVHILTTYAYELADRVQKFYETSLVVENGQVNQRRLALTKAAKQVLANVLGVLGIKAPEKM